MSYYNGDGLLLKFGTEKATPNIGGEFRNYGATREVEFILDLTALTQAENIQSDQVFIPAGARISEVKVTTTTVGATGVAIDLGMIKTDRATQIDYDGLLAAFPLGSMDLAGETTILTAGSTYAGALIGTTTAYIGYVTCSATTSAVFTTGKITVSIRYYIP